MKFEDILDRIAEAAGEDGRAQAEARFDSEIASHRQECESPIEIIMLAALFREAWREDSRMGSIIPRQQHDLFVKNVDAPTPLSCNIFIQFKIADLRVDFFLQFYGGIKIVVECDGHNWHERTPEQAQRDKSRDRILQTNGCRVLRFTGREIWRDPERCAQEVFSVAVADWTRHVQERDD